MHKSRKSVFLLHRLVCQEVQFPVWLEHFSESRPLKEENYPTLKFGSQDQAVWFSCRVTRPVLNKSLFCAFWTQVTGCAFWCSHHSWTSDFSGQKWGAPGYYVLVHQMWNVAGCRVASSRCDHQRGCLLMLDVLIFIIKPHLQSSLWYMEKLLECQSKCLSLQHSHLICLSNGFITAEICGHSAFCF